jgi:HPt (histidine-containing phosphotransfer) domain-containing protein
MVISRELPASAYRATRLSKLLAQDRRIFIEAVTRDLEAIEYAWHQGDEHGLLERLHSLKGALFIFGEHLTAKDCAIVEGVVKTQGLEACASDIEYLRQSLCHLMKRYATG